MYMTCVQTQRTGTSRSSAMTSCGLAQGRLSSKLRLTGYPSLCKLCPFSVRGDPARAPVCLWRVSAGRLDAKLRPVLWSQRCSALCCYLLCYSTANPGTSCATALPTLVRLPRCPQGGFFTLAWSWVRRSASALSSAMRRSMMWCSHCVAVELADVELLAAAAGGDAGACTGIAGVMPMAAATAGEAAACAASCASTCWKTGSIAWCSSRRRRASKACWSDSATRGLQAGGGCLTAGWRWGCTGCCRCCCCCSGC